MSLFDRLDAALAHDAPAEMLPGDLHDGHDGSTLREAAVLVAITDRAEPGVILTRRRADLRDHGGQISFPGGRIDDGESATEAALREAWEEVALDPATARVVGEVDHYRTVTGFGVTPVIAVIPPDPALTANPTEVESWFEAPLGYILDPANQLRRTAEFRGKRRGYYEITVGKQVIWGATAAMIVNLGRRLRWK